jgi:hypothetical protein
MTVRPWRDTPVLSVAISHAWIIREPAVKQGTRFHTVVTEVNRREHGGASRFSLCTLCLTISIQPLDTGLRELCVKRF